METQPIVDNGKVGGRFALPLLCVIVASFVGGIALLLFVVSR